MIIDFIHVCDMLRGLKSDLEFLLFQTFLSLAYQEKWCHPQQFCNDMSKFIELLNRAYFKAKEAPLKIDNKGDAWLDLGENKESPMTNGIHKKPPHHSETNKTEPLLEDPSRQVADEVVSKDGKKLSSSRPKGKNPLNCWTLMWMQTMQCSPY